MNLQQTCQEKPRTDFLYVGSFTCLMGEKKTTTLRCSEFRLRYQGIRCVLLVSTNWVFNWMCYLLAAITLTARWRREGDKRMRCCGCSSLCCRIQTWPRRDWQRHDIGSKQKARRRVCWEMRFWKKQQKKNSKSQLLTGGRRRSSFKLDYSCADAAACVSLHHVGWTRLKMTQKFSEAACIPALCSPVQTKSGAVSLRQGSDTDWTTTLWEVVSVH